MENTIQNGYEWCCAHGGDIREHIPTLRQYAEKVNHITEFGVRDVISTWAFLAGRPKKLISYDIADTMHAPKCMAAAKNEGLDWSFIIGNTLEVDIAPTDLLFIDTLHTYDQLRQELERHADKVRHYIILHDTTSYEHKSEFQPGSTKGLWDAVEEFLKWNSEWIIKERFTNCNGLTILQRVLSKRKVSIVIPTWNHCDDLLKPCIESILRNTTDKYELELIVVSNGSTDNTEEYCASMKDVRGFKYRIIPEQIGFTKAANIGFKMASFNHVMIFNNDILVLDWGKDIWLDRLFEPFEQDPKVAATGPLQLTDSYTEREFLVGFCILFRADLLEEFGYFDEIFAPAGGEDIDLCIKLQDAGWKTVSIQDVKYVGWTHSGDYPMYHLNNKSYGTIAEYTNVIMPRNGEINRQRHKKEGIKMNVSQLAVDSANMSTDAISKKEIWELNTYGVIRNEVEGKVVIDIGAFNGDSALYFKEMGASIVHAFEMNPDNFTKLVDAIREKQGIVAYNTAVYTQESQFVQFSGAGGTCKIAQDSASPMIPAVSLESLLKSIPTSEVVLKIDCEGAEFPILMNTPRELIRRFSFIYAEIHGEETSGHKIDELVKYLADAGFEPQHQSPHDVFYYEKDHLGEIFFTKTIAQTYKFIRRDAPINVLVENPSNPYGVTAYISTKDRYFTTLPLAITSIANQTFKVDELIIFDDGEQRDLRGESLYMNIFRYLEMKNISWRVLYGERKGQVLNHQKALDLAKTEYIWRVDDDNMAEPTVLETLMSHIVSAPDVGGVGSLVRVPNQEIFPLERCSGYIQHSPGTPNLQWSSFSGVLETDHLHNTFLYRKSAAKHGYPKNLSPVGHREETMFTYGIRQNGYRLLVVGDVITWHFRESKGGIRAFTEIGLWEHDEQIFKEEMKKRGVIFDNKKYVVLDNGIGDHYAFKHVLPKLIEKYGAENIVLATCFPDVFSDMPVKQISIAEANTLFGDLTRFNIYHWMWRNRSKEHITKAFERLYL